MQEVLIHLHFLASVFEVEVTSLLYIPEVSDLFGWQIECGLFQFETHRVLVFDSGR